MLNCSILFFIGGNYFFLDGIFEKKSIYEMIEKAH